jgi:GNAT superfamily N-acetyltransferase
MGDDTSRTDPREPTPHTAPDRGAIRVREAGPHDSETIVRLLEEIMAHHGVARPPRDDLTSALDSIFASDSHLFLVAEAGRTVVGMCALVMSTSTWSAGPVCEVQDVIVTDSRRGRGVGRLLLETAEHVARGRGCARLFLTAETANLGAHSFYRSAGFDEKAVLHFERRLAEHENA